MFQNDAKAKELQLAIRYHSVAITIDPLVAMRLMNNLVANAIAHAKATRILVTFRRRSDHLLFQVFDNGCGMSEQALSSLLQLGNKSDDSTGHGLGLGIVQSLCDQHHIPFIIQSELNRGTRCELRIPLIAPNKSAIINMGH